MCLIDRERADGRAGSEWARVAFKVRGLKHCTRHDRQKRRKRIICGRKRWIECTDCLAKDKYSIRLVGFFQSIKVWKGHYYYYYCQCMSPSWSRYFNRLQRRPHQIQTTGWRQRRHVSKCVGRQGKGFTWTHELKWRGDNCQENGIEWRRSQEQ